ncbi:MAG: alpha/beta hydrolase [Gammaproteobacteria bacterium]|nr:alpha/beta hydrolase [Gammaproteobacteria bacterium]
MHVRTPIAALTALFLLAGCTGPQLLNSMTPTRGYAWASNLVYDEATGLRLDVFTPDQTRNAPVIVFFFGNRWTEGDKEQYRFVGEALASQGFVAVVPNYRMYPQVRFPAFVQDGARAVAWARANAARYGGDPKKLFVMGHSAGAHIAAMLALNEEYLKGVGGTRYWLKGMIGLAGPYDFLPIVAPDLRDIFGPEDRFELSQPLNFADGENPPLLLVHAEDDPKIPIRNTRNLADRVRHEGGWVDLVVYPELKCMFGVDSHSCLVAALSSPLRQRSDLLGHIADFVRVHAEAPDREQPGIKASPIGSR